MDEKEMLVILMERTAAMMEHMSEQDSKFEVIEHEIKELRGDVSEIKLTLENDFRPKINLLSEGFEGYTQRLPAFDKAIEDIEEIKLDVDILKTVVTKQGHDINKLKIVK